MSAVAVQLVCAASLLAASAAAPAIAGRKSATPFIYLSTLAISLVAGVGAVSALLTGVDDHTILPIGLPWLGAHFRIDPLSAFFLVVINLGGASASLYGVGYGRHEQEPQRVLPFFPAFLAGMNLVVVADDAFSFLLCWEFMSLASFALVLAHHRNAENRKAAYVYILMASFGTLALLFAFGLLAGPGGGYEFTSIRGAERSALVDATVLALMLLGAGSKAGLVPLHVWLPLAHPAAPSHVSALMSGVMTKVAVYCFIRVIFDLVGVDAWGPSAPVMLIGGVTAVLGILHANMERDSKRLLAYSTIENIGVIFAALGLAMAFRANGMGLAAALAFTAALFHVLNHAVFKSLLFFSAGAVLTATGARDLDRLGGLIHRMPALAPMALIGCVAISALPPLNGFVSEWLVFQAVLQSPALPQFGLKILAPTVGGLLALAAALAATCFVRFYGVAFLGRPRSIEAAAARDVDRWSLTAMAILSILCVILGILPGPIIDVLAPVATAMVGASMPSQTGHAWWTTVPIVDSRSSYNALLLFAFIAFSATLAAIVSQRIATSKVRRGPAWGCGFPATGPETQYTAASFAQPIRNTLGRVAFDARDIVDMPAPGDRRPARHEARLKDHIWDGVYAPVAAAIGALSLRLNALQFLTIRRYLSLVFATLVILLLGLAVWS